MLAQHGILIFLKKIKNKIQTSQNKCIRFCLQLDKMSYISQKKTKKKKQKKTKKNETLDWLIGCPFKKDIISV